MSHPAAQVKDHGPAGSRREIGRRLARHRTAAGLGVRKAAGLAGISASHLSMVENAQHGASPETLAALASVYGCEINDFLPDDD